MCRHLAGRQCLLLSFIQKRCYLEPVGFEMHYSNVQLGQGELLKRYTINWGILVLCLCKSIFYPFMLPVGIRLSSLLLFLASAIRAGCLRHSLSFP